MLDELGWNVGIIHTMKFFFDLQVALPLGKPVFCLCLLQVFKRINILDDQDDQDCSLDFRLGQFRFL
jgi:hypothetical protein